MKREEFYKTVRKENDVKNMDIILVKKTGTDTYNNTLIIDALGKEDFEYALQKILEYDKNVKKIVINTSSNDGPDFIEDEVTSTFINEGGFKKEYEDYLDENDTDKIIKKTKENC